MAIDGSDDDVTSSSDLTDTGSDVTTPQHTPTATTTRTMMAEVTSSVAAMAIVGCGGSSIYMQHQRKQNHMDGNGYHSKGKRSKCRRIFLSNDCDLFLHFRKIFIQYVVLLLLLIFLS